MAEKENTKLGVKVVTCELLQDMHDKYLDRLHGKSDMPIGKAATILPSSTVIGRLLRYP